jgi:hypothetical protein
MFGMAVRALYNEAELEIDAMVRGEKNYVTSHQKPFDTASLTLMASLPQPITKNTTKSLQQ